MNSFIQGSNNKLLETKAKAVIYPTDILDQRQLKNLKLNTFHPFVEPRLYISGSTKNIIRKQLTSLYHPLPNLDDQILQLIQGTLN